MFKKFFIVLTLCLGIFSSMAFASTQSEVQTIINSIPKNLIDIVSKNYNINKYVVVEDQYFYYISFAPDNATTFIYSSANSGSITHNGTGYGQIRFCKEDSSYSTISSSSAKNLGLTLSNSKGVYGNIDITNIPSSLYNKTVFNFPQEPLLKGEKIQAALGNLMKDFGAKLKVLLPVGVTVLALLLGVSLVPRLVRLFL